MIDHWDLNTIRLCIENIELCIENIELSIENIQYSTFNIKNIFDHHIIMDLENLSTTSTFDFAVLDDQKGGTNKNEQFILENTSTGSFPPIYVSTKDEITREEQLKNRQFVQTNKTVVSMKEIMEERRNEKKKPFISL